MSSHQVIVASDHLVASSSRMRLVASTQQACGTVLTCLWCLVMVMVQFIDRKDAENVFLGELRAPVGLQSDGGESKPPLEHLWDQTQPHRKGGKPISPLSFVDLMNSNQNYGGSRLSKVARTMVTSRLFFTTSGLRCPSLGAELFLCPECMLWKKMENNTAWRPQVKFEDQRQEHHDTELRLTWTRGPSFKGTHDNNCWLVKREHVFRTTKAAMVLRWMKNMLDKKCDQAPHRPQANVRTVQRLHQRNLGHPSTYALTELLESRQATEAILEAARTYKCVTCLPDKKPNNFALLPN